MHKIYSFGTSIVMKKIIFNKDQRVNMQSHDRNITPCSFRVPEYLESVYDKRIKQHHSLGLYFDFLLKKYKHIVYTGGLPQFKTIKKVYQDRGLNAKQVSFRATSEDWLEFKILSEALNMSMCKLFVYLLLLDCSKLLILIKKYFAGTVVTTLKLYKLTCITSFSPKNQQIERLFRFRQDRISKN